MDREDYIKMITTDPAAMEQLRKILPVHIGFNSSVSVDDPAKNVLDEAKYEFIALIDQMKGKWTEVIYNPACYWLNDDGDIRISFRFYELFKRMTNIAGMVLKVDGDPVMEEICAMHCTELYHYDYSTLTLPQFMYFVGEYYQMNVDPYGKQCISYIYDDSKSIVTFKIDDNRKELLLGHFRRYVKCIVTKQSGKPFKSGDKEGMVMDVVVNPRTGLVAFRMDDDSIVDVHQTLYHGEKFSDECFLKL